MLLIRDSLGVKLFSTFATNFELVKRNQTRLGTLSPQAVVFVLGGRKVRVEASSRQKDVLILMVEVCVS